MTNLIDLVTIREFKEGDINFLLSSFIGCLSQYHESMFKGWLSKDIHEHLEQIILYALVKLDYSAWIAANKDDTDTIIGYIIGDPKRNHIFFNYTKYSFRKLGIQQNMLLPLIIDPSQLVTINWQTKEALKLHKKCGYIVRNVFLEQIMELSR